MEVAIHHALRAVVGDPSQHDELLLVKRLALIGPSDVDDSGGGLPLPAAPKMRFAASKTVGQSKGEAS